MCRWQTIRPDTVTRWSLPKARKKAFAGLSSITDLASKDAEVCAKKMIAYRWTTMASRECRLSYRREERCKV